MLPVLISCSGLSPLTVKRWAFTDALNTTFHLTLTVISSEPIDKMEGLLARAACVNFAENLLMPEVSGVVDRIALVSAEADGAYIYEITIVPQLWLLSQSKGCRVFQHMTTIEIVSAVLNSYGILAPNVYLFANASAPRVYCVQWEETDLAFVQRLLAEDGLTTSFRTAWEVTDDTSVEGEHQILPYCPPGDAFVPNTPHVLHVRYNAVVRPARVMTRDYDYQRPHLLLQDEAKKSFAENPDLSMYFYAGGHLEGRANQQLQEFRSGARVAQLRLSEAVPAGTRLSLQGYPHDDLNRAWLVVAMRSNVTNGDAEHWAYVVPAEEPWRPAVLSKPRIHGLQNAVVVGPPGTEIHTDQLGRVQMKLHWDRRPETENTSPWIRVSTVWAGAGHGGLWLPRVGDEVLIGYEGGDPDRPVIVGSMYNRLALSTVPLPQDETISGLISRSTPGDDHNAFLMQDKAGGEMIFVRTPGKLVLSAGKSADLIIGSKTLPLNAVSGAGGDGAGQMSPDGHLTVSVAKGIGVGTLGSFTLGAAENVQMSAGVDMLLQGGGSVTVQAVEKLTLVCGGSSITLTPGGIVIESNGTIKIQGSFIELNPG